MIAYYISNTMLNLAFSFLSFCPPNCKETKAFRDFMAESCTAD